MPKGILGASIVLFAVTFCSIQEAAAFCCDTSCCVDGCWKYTCPDCTAPTPCCATGACNILCCHCDGHCRTGSCCPHETEGESLARAFERFRWIDADRNGTLSKREVKRFLRRAGRYNSRRALDEGFAAADLSADGELDLWEYDPDVAAKYANS